MCSIWHVVSYWCEITEEITAVYLIVYLQETRMKVTNLLCMTWVLKCGCKLWQFATGGAGGLESMWVQKMQTAHFSCEVELWNHITVITRGANEN